MILSSNLLNFHSYYLQKMVLSIYYLQVRKIHHMENLLGKQLIKIEYYEELLKVAGEHFQVDIKEKFLKKS